VPEAAVSTADRNERWRQLLSRQRVGSPYPPGESSDAEERTDYDKDYDRIVFSSAFRRLHDKTQVFPLSTSDYTRTRLTHSIEASCVGRSLGQLAGRRLRKQGVDVDPAHLGTIVAAACLAHDIGNPPFGHSGEDAIQHWAELKWPQDSGRPALFENDAQWRDVLKFEGNAQGFRILNRLQSRDQEGGLRYTVATVGAMSKYPCPSSRDGWTRNKERVSQKKFGYFQDDAKLAEFAFRTLGLRESAPGVFARHPLAFLVEAADDICYALIDLEDSVELKLIPVKTACDLMEHIASLGKPSSSAGSPRKEQWDSHAQLSRARSGAIGVLINTCVDAFAGQVEKMEAGECEVPLVDVREEVSEALEAITRITREHGYNSERVLQIESAGFRTLGGLLQMFAEAVMADRPNKEEKKLRQLLPLDQLQRHESYEPDRDRAIERLTKYQRLLCVTDYISGMTDGFAVELYQRLSGIKLPT
jgi:dGTPase